LRSCGSRPRSRRNPGPGRNGTATFEPADEPLLARPLPVAEKERTATDPGYDAALDNALLLLFAGAWNAVPEDRKFLRTATVCAARIIG